MYHPHVGDSRHVTTNNKQQTEIKIMNRIDNSKGYGYIITTAREQGTYGPISDIDSEGNYAKAFADSQNGVSMAIYPTKQDAETEINRVCKGADPMVFDGMRAVTLRLTKNETAVQCAIYGYVSYPYGEPEKTDYERMYNELG